MKKEGIHIGKKEVKLSPLTEEMTLCIYSTKTSMRKLLEQINEVSKEPGTRSVISPHAIAVQYRKKIKKESLFYSSVLKS